MDDEELTIHCSCGAVSMTLAGPPLAQFYCDCDDCQEAMKAHRVGGSIWPSAAATVAGDLAPIIVKHTPRYACASCGTFMYMAPKTMPFYGVNAELLPVGMFEPAWHHQVQHASAPIEDDLPRYDVWPPKFTGGE